MLLIFFFPKGLKVTAEPVNTRVKEKNDSIAKHHLSYLLQLNQFLFISHSFKNKWPQLVAIVFFTPLFFH